jgi:hypothetical protein
VLQTVAWAEVHRPACVIHKTVTYFESRLALIRQDLLEQDLLEQDLREQDLGEM